MALGAGYTLEYERSIYIRALRRLQVDLTGAVQQEISATYGCSLADVAQAIRAAITPPPEQSWWTTGIYIGPYFKQLVRMRDGQRCQYCGVTTAPRFVVEHIIPAAWGGPARPYNLTIACASCNRRKRQHVWVPRNLNLLTANYPTWRRLICAAAGYHVDVVAV